MSIKSFRFKEPWLTDHGEAHIVLAQVSPPPLEILTTGASRPWVTETARKLLGSDQGLAQIVTGGGPAILIFPELAFGFVDWKEIDELVRGWPQDLIVISGFGFVSGENLVEWLSEHGETHRLATWNKGTEPRSQRTYNGGWCWVKTAAATQCITFLKTTAEQSEEIHVAGLAFGSEHLLVHLGDLMIFPVICSDMLNISEGVRVVRNKIARALEEEKGVKVLVAGLLLQKRESPKWHSAILEMANMNSVRVNICLVNSAHDIFAMREEYDRWRGYSGMYIAAGRKPHQDQFSAVRCFANDNIEAAVVRATVPVVLGGPLRWTFDGATGRHIWAVGFEFGLAQNGALVQSPCSDRFKYEAKRILRRIMHAEDAPPDHKATNANMCYEVVASRVDSETSKSTETMCRKLLFGDTVSGASLTADTLSNFIDEVAIGAKVLGALKIQQNIEWRSAPTGRGQLSVPDRDIDILVWCYPGRHSQMRQTIQRWQSEIGATKPTVVFTKALETYSFLKHPPSQRRSDIASPPPSTRRVISEATLLPTVVECDLDEINDCFGETSKDSFVQAVGSRLKKGLNQLNVVQ